MEWVEVTGKTVEEAQAAALDHLGVHESEAEFDVVSEGRAAFLGLFGRDARVRARVLPKQPRPKQERRPRKGKSGGGGRGGNRSSGRDGAGNSGGGKKRGDRSKGSSNKGSSNKGSSGNDDRGRSASTAEAGSRSGEKGRAAKQDRQSGDQAGTGRKRQSPKQESAKIDDGAADRSETPKKSSSAERGPRERSKGRDSGKPTVESSTPASPAREAATQSPTRSDSSTATPPVPDERSNESSPSTRHRGRPAQTAAGVTGAAGAAAGVGGIAAAKASSSKDRGPETAPQDDKQEEIMSTDEITVEQQGEIASDFLDGLLEAFGADGEISSSMVDDDVIEVAVQGNDLGLMVGPKGSTLHAIQELARTAVQRSGQGTHRGRLVLDVGGYRQHRRAALEKFAGQVAERVLAENKEHALEPMNSADRKAIHDAVNEIDGVRTISEGQEPRRRIVILPAD